MTLEKFSKQSANIVNTEYDKEKKELFVTFKNPKTGVTNGTYKYSGVSEEKWEELKKAESLGGYINKVIVRGGYQFEKL